MKYRTYCTPFFDFAVWLLALMASSMLLMYTIQLDKFLASVTAGLMIATLALRTFSFLGGLVFVRISDREPLSSEDLLNHLNDDSEDAMPITFDLVTAIFCFATILKVSIVSYDQTLFISIPLLVLALFWKYLPNIYHFIMFSFRSALR